MTEYKRSIFQNEIDAIMYTLVSVTFPCASVMLALYFMDKTLYILLLSTVLGLGYSFIASLFSGKMSKSLFVKSVFAFVIEVLCMIVCITKIILIAQSSSENVQYSYSDIFFTVFFLAAIIILYVTEVTGTLKYSYEKKVLGNNDDIRDYHAPHFGYSIVQSAGHV